MLILNYRYNNTTYCLIDLVFHLIYTEPCNARYNWYRNDWQLSKVHRFILL